jgi:hypothetical protein
LDTKGLIRVVKAQLKLVCSGMDQTGLIQDYLDEIPIRLSRRPSGNRCGSYHHQGVGDVGYVVINLNMCTTEPLFSSTLIHELAHGVCRWRWGDEADSHGPRWQDIMVKMGQTPSRCLSL